MGIGGISVWQLLIVLAIVIMLFGTKRLRTLGSDLGSAVKGFKKSMQDDDGTASDEETDKDAEVSTSLQQDESVPPRQRDQHRDEHEAARREEHANTSDSGAGKP